MRNQLSSGVKRHLATVCLLAFVGALVFLGSGCPCDSSTGRGIGGYQADEVSSGLPLSLEWNLGQADAKYKIVGHAAGYTLGLSGNEVSLDLRPWRHAGREGRLTARLVNARQMPQIEVDDALPGRSNYFLGNRPERWITDVPTFERARFRDVYPGIDVVYYGRGARFEHDFVVRPGADPSVIEMAFGSGAILNGDGDLVVETAAGEVLWKKPELYQETPAGRRKVEGRYKAGAEGRVRFEVGVYDPRRALVIDPVIVYGNYIGGNGSEFGSRIGVDAAGNSYFAGATADSNFLISTGAPQSPVATATTGDILLTKVNADGSAILFSTRLGGFSIEVGLAVAVDNAGNLYVTGGTYSRDYPTTASAYKPAALNSSLNDIDQGDCFVSKLSTTGNRMIYSTYLGGRNQDACLAIAVDGSGSAYVTGVTMSSDYPAIGAFQGALRFGLKNVLRDAFVTKLSADGSSVVYSSFLGGNGDDVGTGIAVDAAGNAYITGFTDSRGNFPVTQGVLQSAFKGGGDARNAMGDAFVAKVNPSGDQLVYATYLGGSLSDAASSIAVDAQGNAYVAGSTMSTDFPATPQAFQAAFKGAGTVADPLCTAPVLCIGEGITQAGDGFVAKLNPAGAGLVYATYLGGSVDDRVLSIALDSRNQAWVTGNTMSSDFPVSTDAAQRTYGGHPLRPGIRFGDAFATQLDASGRALVYSTYVGGSADDFGAGIAVDASGSAYLTGGTMSTNFPSTRGAARAGYGGHTENLIPAGDAFLVKIGEPPRVEEPRPAIGAVSNLASGVGGVVAPGMVVAISGTNLGTAVSDVRVLFNQTAAPVVAVSATSITAIVPFGLAAGTPVQVTVENKTIRSAAVTVPVNAASPGLFTVAPVGRGQAEALNEDRSANSVDAPAAVGSIVTLFATGGGVTDPPSTDGAIATDDGPALAQTVSVLFGDVAAEEVFFAGGVKGRAAGYFQVVARIPQGVAAGEVPVVLRVGEAQSQEGVTIQVQNVLITGEDGARGRRP